MGVMRSLLLAGSQSQWLKEQATRYGFVRRSVERFMPGEELEDALRAARTLEDQGIGTVFTKLGENITERHEAESVTDHYLGVFEKLAERRLGTEVSVKLTQLGLDIDPDFCYAQVERLILAAPTGSIVWIDMESTQYTDITLDLYRRALRKYSNVGVCLQAYLYRTADDIAKLLPMAPAVRLVKGAYREPAEVAFPKKADVDENFFDLTRMLLGDEARKLGARYVAATHDAALIRRIQDWTSGQRIPKQDFAFTMLYGIQRGEQIRLSKEGHVSKCLIAYGPYWFPWFMRRLAERPANVLFVARNLLSN